MKVLKKDLRLREGLQKEWLITNGLGGYSSSTVIGINTRKYHGLLVAPLTPPARRTVILSKVDEAICVGNKKYDIYSNISKGHISHGYEYQEEFEKEYIPVFTYSVGDITIKKSICMQYNKNTVCVLYQIENKGKQATFSVTPIMNFRDFHTMNSDHNFDIYQEIKGKKVKLVLDHNSYDPVYMYVSDGEYIEHFNDQFNNMLYVEEEKRGFYPEENHSVPGRYEVTIPEKSNKEISFICSLEENIEEIDVKKVINKEIMRLDEIMYKTELVDKKQEIEKALKEELEKRDLLKNLIIAADNFVVYRPSFGLRTIIAGYPWFLDWGRDTLISFEGLLLVTKRFDVAKEVLRTIVKDIKFGLVPNGYSGHDNRPLYNSADSSLLLFEAVYKYMEYSGDISFVKTNIYNKLVTIIDKYQKGIDIDNNNIFMDVDGLISSGTLETQNTWMDAKYGTYVVTPRNGKAVEINSLWYNALKVLEELSTKFGKKDVAKECKRIASIVKTSFNEQFYNPKKKCLYDVIGDSKVRPNQLFSMSLTFPVVDPDSDVAENIIETTEKKLLNNYGLKTLAKGEKGYIEVYEGDGVKRDSSYHQGITWPWLLGLYYNSLKNMVKFEKNKTKKKELEKKLENFITTTEKTFVQAIYEEGALGSISELYDSKKPHLPKGTIAQAWSVAEVFRILLRK